MQESSNNRNFFQRNKVLLFIGVNLYVQQTLPDAYEKSSETDKEIIVATPKPSEHSGEGIPCGGIGGFGDCPQGYECIVDPDTTKEPVGDAGGICVKKQI